MRDKRRDWLAGRLAQQLSEDLKNQLVPNTCDTERPIRWRHGIRRPKHDVEFDLHVLVMFADPHTESGRIRRDGRWGFALISAHNQVLRQDPRSRPHLL